MKRVLFATVQVLTFTTAALAQTAPTEAPTEAPKATCEERVQKITEAGVPLELLNRMSEKAATNNKKAGKKIAIVDYSKKSNEKRLFLIDPNSGAVEGHLVSHGIGNDPDNDGFANEFPTIPTSRAVPLGLYEVHRNYRTRNGLQATIIKGLEESNRNADARGIRLQQCKFIALNGRNRVARSWGSFCVNSQEYGQIDKSLRSSLLYADVSGKADPGSSLVTTPSDKTCSLLGLERQVVNKGGTSNASSVASGRSQSNQTSR